MAGREDAVSTPSGLGESQLGPSALQFFCPGHPKAQGSKRHVGRGIMVESSKDLAPWRQAVAEYARREGTRFSAPVYLQLCFWFQRPASHYGTGRNAGKLKRTAPMFREKQPDLDKCIRAVCDALVIAQTIPDDRWIVKLYAEKRYGDPGVLVSLQAV
jgi:crossover junction endodeoxyribonuclease RusA